MSRPKGLPKTGGRQKGTPNRSTKRFQESLDNLGFDIAEAAVKLFNSSTREDFKLNCLKLLAEYSCPRPKAPDDTAEPPKQEPAIPENEADLLSIVKPE
jgi:hypothetical protein